MTTTLRPDIPDPLEGFGPWRIADAVDAADHNLPAVAITSSTTTYYEARPEQPLSDVIAAAWVVVVAEHTQQLSHRVFPDGCADLVRTPSGAGLALGPLTGWHDAPLIPGEAVLGVRLMPGAAGRLLGVPGGELTDQATDLADLVARARHLNEVDPHAWHSQLISRLIRPTASTRPPDALVQHALRRLGAPQEPASLVALAEALDVSPRTLRRRFQASVGLRPVQYRRHRRLQRLLSDARAHNHSSWTTLAYRHGYADQAHMSREVLHLTGHAPGHLLPRHDACPGSR